jgi:membrane-bound lytic murein transglycosylase MltF
LYKPDFSWKELGLSDAYHGCQTTDLYNGRTMRQPTRCSTLALACLVSFLTSTSAALAQSPPSQGKPNVIAPRVRPIERKGDLDELLKSRAIRVAVPYSKTQYYVVKGTPRGVTYEMGKAFEDYLNRNYPQKTKNIRIHVAFFAQPRDKLFSSLIEGSADIAAAGLTITPERQRLADFSEPVGKGVNEIAVTGPQSPKLASLNDLAGQEVFLRKSSSYWGHVERLNEQFHKEGKTAIKLSAVPDNLEDEDLLEMVNAGLLSTIIVDDYAAKLWSKLFTRLQLHTDITVNTGGEFAWAMRKNSPQLVAAVNDFLKTHRQGTAFGNALIQKYTASTVMLKEATSAAAMKRFEETAKIFQKYSSEYHMDYLLLMAEGFQESGLNQAAKSQVGAVGVMQLMPATGEQMKVGDIHQEDANIHAGIKYFHSMVDKYYGNEPMDDVNKVLFTFAAYNCGPGRVRQLRAEAAQKGLDPNVWLGNVEFIAAARVGPETVNYVTNIYKYYIAYKLIATQEEERRKSKESVQHKPS